MSHKIKPRGIYHGDPASRSQMHHHRNLNQLSKYRKCIYIHISSVALCGKTWRLAEADVGGAAAAHMHYIVKRK